MIYVLFRVRGKGTRLLSQYKKGDLLDIIGPLGKGFDDNPLLRQNDQIILVAGGMGVAPLVFLAQKLSKIHQFKTKVISTVLLGAKTKNEVLCENDFRQLGFQVYVTTEDGSRGHKKQRVTDLLRVGLPTDRLLSAIFPARIYIYSCGPKEMFLEINKIINKSKRIHCQVSFEQFMGCGLGVCCGCTIETKQGYKKVCKDGPVFDIKDIK